MVTLPSEDSFKPLNLPLGWTFGALVAGLVLGLLLGGTSAADPVLSVTETIGSLWLRALQMTIIPLVAALLVTGIARMVETASAGAMARRTLLTIFAVLACGTLLSAIVTPLLLEAFPIPVAAGQALAADPGEAEVVPGIGQSVLSLVAPNLVAAAAENAMLPLVVFFALFGVAVAQLPERQRQLMKDFFAALGNAMLAIIGWVLWLAPAGVFALAIGVAARAGGGAFLALGHYIVIVASLGLVVLIAAYPVGIVLGRKSPAAFARAVLPAQAVAFSTRARLPACRRCSLRAASSVSARPAPISCCRWRSRSSARPARR